MRTREDIVTLIRSEWPELPGSLLGMADEAILAELGLTSIDLITMVLTLQRKYNLDLDRMIQCGMPVTFGDLVGMICSGSLV